MRLRLILTACVTLAAALENPVPAVGFKGREPNTIFLNLRDGTFADEFETAGLTADKAHRGSSFVDLDGDSKIDVVVTSLREPVEPWHHLGGVVNQWIDLNDDPISV